MVETEINKLIYIKIRQPLLELDDEQLAIRRPSTEVQQKDRGTQLLKRYNDLQEALVTARQNIWSTVNFNEDVGEHGEITLSAFNSGKFSALQKEIKGYLEQIATIETALKALAKINAPFDHELLKLIHTIDHNIRSIDSELNRLQNSTRVQENQPKIKQLQQEKAKLEKELSKAKTVKEQVDTIFDGVDFSKACSAREVT